MGREFDSRRLRNLLLSSVGVGDKTNVVMIVSPWTPVAQEKMPSPHEWIITGRRQESITLESRIMKYSPISILYPR